MKKKALLALILALVISDCAAQLLSADAEGKSAILFDANAINFDIAETALSLHVNNFQRQNIAERRQTVWGLSAKGKNNEGIANFISEGKFLPSGQIGMFIGQVIRGPKSDFEMQDRIRQNRESRVIKNYEAWTNFRATADSIWKKEQATIPAPRRKKMKADLLKAVNHDRYQQAAAQLDLLKAEIDNWKDTIGGPPVADQIKNAKILVDSVKSKLEFNYKKTLEPSPKNPGETLEAAYERESDEVDLMVDQESEIREKSTPYKIAPYLSFGLTGSQIKIYDKTVSEPFTKRFVKTPFTGVFADVGVNFDAGKKSLVGISFGFERANTIDSLTATDYIIREIEKTGNTELISETKERGYTGTYETFTRINLRADWLHFFELGKKGQLIWNMPYVRYAISDKSRAAIDLLNIGTSANFFKEEGKFAGGVYIEVGDIGNQQYHYQLDLAPGDEAKEFVKQNKSTVWKRITFGVVAKFALQTIVDPLKW